MYVGDVFSDSKWDILKDLSEKKFSPLQLAEKYKTTVGNVGHQLRLLEAFGLIKKEKISNREKGKPRTLFSLAYDCAFLASATDGFADRKLLKLSDHHDTILKMWFIDDTRLHYYLEKFYWKIEDHIDKINGIAVRSAGDMVHVVILTKAKKQLEKKIGSEIILKDREGVPLAFVLRFMDEEELKSFGSLKEHHVIYDPNNVLGCYKQSFSIA